MLHHIYVIFTFSGTIPSRIIRKITKQKYSHVSISMDHDLHTMYSFARKYIYNPFNSGFVIESIDKGLLGKLPNVSGKIYELEVGEEEYRKIIQILNKFQKKQHRLKYNFFGLLSPILGIPIRPKNAYFCSQFVSKVLVDSGTLSLDKEPIYVTPGELEHSLNANVLYEGNLKLLKSQRSA